MTIASATSSSFPIHSTKESDPSATRLPICSLPGSFPCRRKSLTSRSVRAPWKNWGVAPMCPETPGPVLHLHALAAALDHEFLYDTPIALDFATVCSAGVLAWVLVAFLRRPLFCLITLL